MSLLARLGPPALLLASALAAAGLWWTDTHRQAVAFAEVATISLAAPTQGVVAAVAVQVGDHVEAARLLLGMADPATQAERRTLEAERDRLEALRDDAGRERARDRDRVELERLREQDAATAATAELATLEAERDRLTDTVQQGLTRAERLGDLHARIAGLRAEAAGHRRAAGLLEAERDALDGVLGADPARAEAMALEVVVRQLEALDAREQGLMLLAPAAGSVHTVHASAGSMVFPGQLLLTLVPDTTTQVIVCLDEAAARRVEAGDRATLSPWDGGPVVHGRVRALDPAVAAHDPRCRTPFLGGSWGRAARVEAETLLIPGQRFSVTFGAAP